MFRTVCFAMAALLLSPVLSAAERPLALHPENPHYFLWREKPTILITSGEHYGSLLNLEFDFEVYLKTLGEAGLNHTRTFSGAYREVPGSFGITQNPLAPKPGKFLAPWKRGDLPSAVPGENKFDLTAWNPDYFTRLHAYMRAAAKHGIVVEFNFFTPLYDDDLWKVSPFHAANNVQGMGKCPRTEVYALKHADLTAVQAALVRKIAAELRDYDNLYYEICNEPYFGGVTPDWQHNMLDALVEAEREFPHQHLLALNVANGRAKVDKPHPAVSIFNFHYCVPPDVVGLNYHLHRVIGENETGFRGQANVLYRTEAWDFLLAGGGLYNNLDYSFSAEHPRGDLLEYKSPGGGNPTFRQQLKILKNFLEGFDFIHMKPNAACVRETVPPLSCWALEKPGEQYALVLHVPLPEKPKSPEKLEAESTTATLKLALPAGRYAAEWVNTQIGHIDKTETFDHATGDKTLVSPLFRVDIALRVIRRD